MSGPKRNPDRLNTIGVVVVGICGAVLVYVTIVALQAFYVDDTSEIQTMADYGGQDTEAKKSREQQTVNLNAPADRNALQAGVQQTYHVPLAIASERLLREATTGKQCGPAGECEKDFECRLVPNSNPADAKNHVCVDLGHLVPAHGRAERPTAMPVPGRPIPMGTGSAGSAASPTPAGSGSAAGSSSEPAMSPTGVPGGPAGGSPPGSSPTDAQKKGDAR